MLALPLGSRAFQAELRKLHNAADHSVVDLALPFEEWKRLLVDESIAMISVKARARLLFVAAHGFEIFPSGESCPMTSRPNHPSVRRGPSASLSAIEAEIQKLISKGWVRPWSDLAIDNPGFPRPKVSPLGAVPKRDSPEPRIIFDLSSPKGMSVNDFSVPPTFSYPTIDTAIEYIRRGSFLSKLDLKSGFHSVPLHPASFKWVGFRWHHTDYAYCVLPFGLAPSPWIFCEFTSFMCATVHRRLLLLWQERGYTSRVPFVVVYVDDFLVVGDSEHDVWIGVRLLEALISQLGFTNNTAKFVAPCTCLSFLGIELDSIAMTARVPDDKVAQLRSELLRASRREKMTKRELQSLLGVMNFAAKVVRAGRAWMRSLIDLTTQVRSGHHFVRLTKAAKEDLKWWRILLVKFNKLPFTGSLDRASAPEVFTDASLSGGGGFWNGDWFRCEWSSRDLDLGNHINVLELRTVLRAAQRWGGRWARCSITIRSDNTATVAALNHYSSRSPAMCRIVREIFFLAVRYDFALACVHVPGKDNELADALSRWNEPDAEMRFDLALAAWRASQI